MTIWTLTLTHAVAQDAVADINYVSGVLREGTRISKMAPMVYWVRKGPTCFERIGLGIDFEASFWYKHTSLGHS